MDRNPNKSFTDKLIINGNLCGSSNPKKVCCVDAGSERVPFGVVVIPVTDSSVRTSTERMSTVSTTMTTRITTETTPEKVTVPSRPDSELLPVPGSNQCGIHFPDKIYGGSLAAIDEHPWLARLIVTYCMIIQVFFLCNFMKHFKSCSKRR